MYKYLIVLALFASCANPKKLHKMMDKLPVATAQECNQRFPIKETIDTLTVADTAMLHAYEQEYLRVILMLNDLMNKGCDTIIREKIKEVVKRIPSKPETKVVIKTQESTAKLEVLKNDCQKTINSLSQINTQNLEKIQKLEDKIKKKNSNLLWLWIIVILLLIWTFRKAILSLLKGFV